MQGAQALEYLESFGLIHRDFRGCNMHLAERGFGRPRLKVLDLGVMIDADDGQQWNTNQAVQAFKRRGETEEKKRRYDWLPWEVRAGADGQAPAVNFAPPVYSFDIFSFGILIFHLLLGRAEARAALETLRVGGNMPDTSSIGLTPDLVKQMFAYESSKRPHPSDVVLAFKGITPEARQRSRSRDRPLRRQTSMGSAKTPPSRRRHRRSRSRSQRGRAEEESDDEPAFADYGKPAVVSPAPRSKPEVASKVETVASDPGPPSQSSAMVKEKEEDVLASGEVVLAHVVQGALEEELQSFSAALSAVQDAAATKAEGDLNRTDELDGVSAVVKKARGSSEFWCLEYDVPLDSA